jgi:cytochrome P450
MEIDLYHESDNVQSAYWISIELNLLIVSLNLSRHKNTYQFPPGNNRWQSLFASITFLKNPIRAISRNMEKFSGTYSAFLTGRGKIILTEDPDFIQYVLRDNHSNYQKSELSTKTAARLFGNGLLFSNGQFWLKQRRLIQPGFHHNKIQGLYGIIINSAGKFISGLPSGENVDVYSQMHKLSFSVLIHSLFDINLSAQTISELSQGFTDLQDFLLKDVNDPFRKMFYPISRADRIVLRKSKKIKDILKEIIAGRRAESNSNNDLLDMLLSARYEDTGEVMTEEQMMDEIHVLLFAGHETTANTLSWLLYLIATHPHVKKKLKSAIDDINILESPKNEYINAVISEAMRLFPAAWMTERVSLTDDQFNGFSFPRGTIIIPFFYGLHRNKKYWSNESAFDPERFIFSDPAKSKKIKNFFPFGAGPRMCIGNNFAMAEIAFILHEFLSKFEISPTNIIPDMWPLITLRPRKLALHIQRI